ncbi:MAG: 4Fe-4S binding protein [Thermodesulfobacteriota bacterium]
MNQLCLNEKYCKGCLICLEICPTGAIKSSGRINPRGYVLPAEDDMNRCTGCGLCETVCPDFAVTVESYGPRGG